MVGNRLFGAALILVGGAAIGLALQIDVLGLGQNQDPGPRAFPIVLGTILLLGGLYEVASSFGGGRAELVDEVGGGDSKGETTGGKNGRKSMGLIFIGICLYVGTIASLGFTLSTFLFAVSMMIRLGVRWQVSLASTLGLLLGIHLLFVRLFKVQLPDGMLGLPF